MRDAHRTYKYVGKKQGKTFGEVLKSTWKLAKLNVTMQEELARQQEERNNKVFTPIKAEKVTFKAEWSDCYNSNSRGYLGSQYCGDKDINQDYPVRSRYRKQSVKGMAGTTWSDCP